MSEPLGGLIDSLGITHEPRDGELITDAIVLLKTVAPDGNVGLRTAYVPGTSWIERVGMLRIAETVELSDLGDEDQ